LTGKKEKSPAEGEEKPEGKPLIGGYPNGLVFEGRTTGKSGESHSGGKLLSASKLPALRREDERRPENPYSEKS